MRAQIALITIHRRHTRSVFTGTLGSSRSGLPIATIGGYEFKHDGVRFALCRRAGMAAGLEGYTGPVTRPLRAGVPRVAGDVDASYAALVAGRDARSGGHALEPAHGVHCRPDGNIHEISPTCAQRVSPHRPGRLVSGTVWPPTHHAIAPARHRLRS